MCVFHGKRRSEHVCLVCTLCFKDLTPEECSRLPNGDREDVCVPCAEAEQAQLVTIAQSRLTDRERDAAIWALDISLGLDRPPPDMQALMVSARAKLDSPLRGQAHNSESEV